MARPTSWFIASGTLEYDGGESVRVFEAYLEAVAATSWHFSAGLRRTPLFHTAKDEYLEGLPIPELSLPVRALWPGIDLGADVHYTPDTLPVEAWIRVGNGSQSIQGNSDEHLAYDARVDWVQGRARGQADSRFGLRIGGGGHIKYQENAPGLTDSTLDGFTFYHPTSTFGWQAIGEAHAAFWMGPLTATLEGGIAREERSRPVPGAFTGQRVSQAPIFTRGAALEVGWMLRGAPGLRGSGLASRRSLPTPGEEEAWRLRRGSSVSTWRQTRPMSGRAARKEGPWP
jgi:phosphate-selective porin OprO/OprP